HMDNFTTKNFEIPSLQNHIFSNLCLKTFFFGMLYWRNLKILIEFLFIRKNRPPLYFVRKSGECSSKSIIKEGSCFPLPFVLCLPLLLHWRWSATSINLLYLMKICCSLRPIFDRDDFSGKSRQYEPANNKDIGLRLGDMHATLMRIVLRKLAQFDKWSKIAIHVAMDNTVVINDIRCLCKSPVNSPRKESDTSCENQAHAESTVRNRHYNQTACDYTPNTNEPLWKPLVLFIPLRLGLSTMNMVYETALKRCFSIRQSLGCIGGRPNHASYFIGCYGSKLLYLDPHVTQNSIVPERFSDIPDETYHCCVSPPFSMNISAIDPSLALGFYCDTEIEFDDLCISLREINKSSSRPIFEIIDNRPPHWPPYEVPTQPNVDGAHLEFETVQSDIDEEYEII
ncbi:cysteine protease ATG4B-like, partial [Paramuricea clavata]